jgi:(p)ppGpp synthase/HD superfamily hydrolase
MQPSVDELLDPAQTNLQLYQQLRRAGRDVAEIEHVRRAYELVMRLFAGQYRGTGRPFVTHLVGTASILVTLGARDAVVRTGLLHAAYTHGAFPGWRRALTERKRQEVRAIAGVETENLVLRYAHLRWTAEVVPSLLDRLKAMSELDRDVVTVRVANELEDLLDRGKVSSAQRASATGAAALAAALGIPALAAALARALGENDAAPRELSRDQGGSFTLAPATHRERVELRLARGLAGMLARLWR